jgi:hypothetical protein
LNGAAFAQEMSTDAATPITTRVLATLPQDVATVTNYYKQDV